MRRGERGEIMIEGTFVAFIATMMIFLFMSICMAVYHQVNLSVAANEAAADVAMTYGTSYKDPFENYTQLDYFTKHELYRHSIFKASHDGAVEDKGKWYACYRLKEGEYVPAGSGYELVDAKLKKNSFGKTQVQVTIERTYPHLTEFPFVMFGLDKEYSIKATGVAECYDMIEYINGITFCDEIAYEVEKSTMLGKFIKEGMTVWSKAVEPLIKMFTDATK